MPGLFRPALLRSEGVIEIGRVGGFLFVLTRAGLRLMHVKSLPDRSLDDYAVQLAVSWIENQGTASAVVARDLGVSQLTLRQALSAAGYERLEPLERERLAHARAARKFGNRRGRLVRVPSKATT